MLKCSLQHQVCISGADKYDPCRLSLLNDYNLGKRLNTKNTAYFEVLQAYHGRQFYQFSGQRPHEFTGYPADMAAPEDFIQALAAQQTEKSAKLLDTMLTYLSRYQLLPDNETIINELIIAIWEHPCPAYAKLREKIRPKAGELLKGRTSVPVESSPMQIDNTERTFRWLP